MRGTVATRNADYASNNFRIGYNDAREYREWTFRGGNPVLKEDEATKELNLYVRLDASPAGATGMAFLSTQDYDFDGYYMDGTTEKKRDEGAFYVCVGTISAPNDKGVRDIKVDSGTLGSDQEVDEQGNDMLEQMFMLVPDGMNNLIAPQLPFTHLIIRNSLTLAGTVVKAFITSDYALENWESNEVVATAAAVARYVKDKIDALDNRFLRKDVDDETTHKLSMGEAQVKGDLTVNGNGTIDRDLTVKNGNGIFKQNVNVAETASAKSLKATNEMVLGTFTPSEESGALGTGARMWMNEGSSMLEIDYLTVRKAATFREITIQELRHIGGELILSAASMKCVRVESITEEHGGAVIAYRCYMESEEGKFNQQFRKGDLARCQQFGIDKGTSHNVSTAYYWRMVVEVGDDYIDLANTNDVRLLATKYSNSLYSTDYYDQQPRFLDVQNTTPNVNDSIVLLGHIVQSRETPVDYSSRQTAIILSATEANAPSKKFYVGIDSLSLEGTIASDESFARKNLLGEDIAKGRMHSLTYGDFFFGDKEGSSFVRYTKEHGVEMQVAAFRVIVNGESKTLDEHITETTEGSIEEALTGFEIFQVATPTFPSLTTEPAVSWTPEQKKLYATSPNNAVYLNSDGRTWKFVYDDESNEYQWVEFTDQYLLSAWTKANIAQMGVDANTATLTLIQRWVGKDATTFGESGMMAELDRLFVGSSQVNMVQATDAEGNLLYYQYLKNEDGLFVDKDGNPIVPQSDWRSRVIDKNKPPITTVSKFPYYVIQSYDKSGLATKDNFAALFSETVDASGNVMSMASLGAYISVERLYDMAAIGDRVTVRVDANGYNVFFSPSRQKYYYRDTRNNCWVAYSSNVDISADVVRITSGNKALGNYFALDGMTGDVTLRDLTARNITVEGVLNNLVNVIDAENGVGMQMLVPGEECSVMVGNDVQGDSGWIYTGENEETYYTLDVLKTPAVIHIKNIDRHILLPYYCSGNRFIRTGTRYGVREGDDARPITYNDLMQMISKRISVFVDQSAGTNLLLLNGEVGVSVNNYSMHEIANGNAAISSLAPLVGKRINANNSFILEFCHAMLVADGQMYEVFYWKIAYPQNAREDINRYWT